MCVPMPILLLPYFDFFQGEKALPILRKYFQSLLNRLEKECCDEEGLSILKWLPNVAVIIGDMSINLPKE